MEKIKYVKLPNVKSLVRQKIYKYISIVCYLFALVCIGLNMIYTMMILAILTVVFGIMSLVYDIKFIKDNYR